MPWHKLPMILAIRKDTLRQGARGNSDPSPLFQLLKYSWKFRKWIVSVEFPPCHQNLSID
jgi:hypothetical protein